MGPTWGDALRCCMKCNASLDTRYDIRGLSSDDCGGFRLNLDSEYDHACDDCEKTLVLTRELHSALIPMLRYDRRQGGNKGLVIGRPGLPGLPIDSRIEPSEHLPHIHDIFELDVFPRTISVWIVGNEQLSKHRNPL